MLALHDADCLLHETVEFIGAKAIPAHESPARLRSILTALQDSPSHSIRELSYSSQPDATKKALLTTISQTHDPGYLQHLQTVFSAWREKDLVEEDGSILPECWRFPTSIKGYHDSPKPPRDIYARTGFYSFDMSSGIMRTTWQSTIASANLAYQGIHTLYPSTSTTTTTSTDTASPSTLLTLCRPPGHHCDGHRAGGYCYINNVSVAISTFRTSISATAPIAILDLDFHHGNGTQELYYADPTVLYVSIHGEDEFPYYTGHASETGLDAGEGYNLNLPLPADSSVEKYHEALDTAVRRVRRAEPALVVVSLGFDTYETDPIGRFKIATEDYEGIARKARGAVPKGAKSLVVFEGGYVVEKLGVNMSSWLKGWEDGGEGGESG
jgi:acetoin utilization deacetylase AcuC-like enzyme